MTSQFGKSGKWSLSEIMWRKIPFNKFYLLAIGLAFITALSIIVLRTYLPPVVPILYGRPVGEAQLTTSLGLLLAPGVSLIITIINILLSLRIKDEYLKKLLAITAIIVSALSAITILRIVLLVGFF